MSLKYSAAGLSDIGQERKENQDTFNIDEAAGFFIVADGMGGMQEGALAAKYVVEGLPAVMGQQISQGSFTRAHCIIGIIKESVAEMSSFLREKVGNNTGATFVSALIKGKKAYIAHLGDSRAYLWRGGNIEQLTKDHNFASLLVDMGKINLEQARTHPMRNRLTAYVGMQSDAIPSVKTVTLESGDVLLLCTDGLYGMLTDQEIAGLLKDERSLEVALGSMIAAANDAGGHDNITAVLISFHKVKEVKR